MITDDRYNELIHQVGNNSLSLYTALHQVENEVMQEQKQCITQMKSLLKKAHGFCQREDVDGDMLNKPLAQEIEQFFSKNNI